MEKLIKSRWVYIYRRRSDFALFNSRNLEIFFADREIVDLLNYFEKPRRTDEVFSFLKNHSQKVKRIVNELINNEFLIPIGVDELENLKKEITLEEKKKKLALGKSLKFNSLRVILMERCNLSCNYCFVRNRKVRKEDDISFPTIIQGIDLLASLNKNDTIEVQFFGGEPLLRWDLVIKTVAYIERLIDKKKIKNVYYGITTNGTLIDQEKSKFFKKHNFLVSLSLDGWESLHNLNRHYLNGKGSFDNALKGLKILKNNKNEIGILITPAKNNVRFLAKSCDYIINKLNCKFITINTPQPIKGNWDVDGVLFSRQIKKCFEVAKRDKAIVNSFGTRVIYALNDKKPLIFSCSKFGDHFTATLTPKGKLSPCIVSWQYPDSLIPLERFNYQGNFADWKFSPPYFFKKCLSCPAMNVCGGPCPLEVYELKKVAKPIDHERCKFFKDFLEWAIWFEG